MRRGFCTCSTHGELQPIHFVSSGLQCLFNQSIFINALEDTSNYPCKDCHVARKCAVSAAANLSRQYVYGKEKLILPSITLQSKLIAS